MDKAIKEEFTKNTDKEEKQISNPSKIDVE